jgi:xanthosine utilization system XapX-like protein
MTVVYMAGQLVFLAIVAAVIGGVIWAVLAMRKPRPPLEDYDDEW